MRVRLTVCLLALGVFLAVPTAETAEATRLRSQPVRSVCEYLTERHKATVRAERTLGELRVLWPATDDAPLRTAVDRLAELTDSLIVSGEGTGGRKIYTLERKRATVLREQQWQIA